jgi:hypothetical protein
MDGKAERYEKQTKERWMHLSCGLCEDYSEYHGQQEISD